MGTWEEMTMEERITHARMNVGGLSSARLELLGKMWGIPELEVCGIGKFLETGADEPVLNYYPDRHEAVDTVLEWLGGHFVSWPTAGLLLHVLHDKGVEEQVESLLKNARTMGR